MSILYEVSFLCVSKEECDQVRKSYYKKTLEEIFQNPRMKFNFEIKTFVVLDRTYNTIKSTIQLYRKLSDEETNELTKKNDKNNEANSNENNKEKEKEKEKKEFNKKVNFCLINKEKLYSNISFYDSIGKFFDKSIYFVKYISNKNIQPTLGTTKIIEIARCGYNMENILKDMGYTQNGDSKNHYGFFYQYKYYPIICIYGVSNVSENSVIQNIFLQIKGYYNEVNKDEIIEKLNEVAKLLQDLFFIKFT